MVNLTNEEIILQLSERIERFRILVSQNSLASRTFAMLVASVDKRLSQHSSESLRTFKRLMEHTDFDVDNLVEPVRYLINHGHSPEEAIKSTAAYVLLLEQSS